MNDILNGIKYSAFISYRHGDLDEFVAKNIHKQLESYKLPAVLAEKTGKKTVGRIFRDVDELPTSDSLYSNIEDALGQSEYLIVICTPRLKESKWCMREIELFTKLRGPEHVLVVLAKGEPEDSFPEILMHRIIDGVEVEVEPLAADVRGDNEHQIKKKIHSERLRLIAALINCEYDDLRQRARQREKKQRTIAFGVAFTVVVAFLGLMTVENSKLQNQVERTQISQSYLLAQYSTDSYKGDDPMTAALLALEGIPENLGNSRPFVGDSMASLTTALQTYNYKKGYVADGIVNTNAMDSSFISPDGSYIAYVDLNNKRDYYVTFYDTAKNKKIKKFPVSEDMCNQTSSEVKVVFFGEHYSAISGVDGMQIIDLSTMKIIWSGDVGTGVNISGDESTLASYDFDNDSIVFYDTETSKKLSKKSWECDSSAPLGFNKNGSFFAMQIDDENGNSNIEIIDVATGKVVADLKSKLGLSKEYSVDSATGEGSWNNNTLVFTIRNSKSDSQKYGYYDGDSSKAYRTDIDLGTIVASLDSKKHYLYYTEDTNLIRANLKDSSDKTEYKAGRAITFAVPCENGMFEVICDDGSLEYVDFNEQPYNVSKQEGDGTGYTMAHIGGDYLVCDLTNGYKVAIYKLNNKTSKTDANLPKVSGEVTAYIIRNKNLMCLNTSGNSYTINLDNLNVVTYDNPVSYMEVGNYKSLLLDDLEGNNIVYDADTGKEKTKLSVDVDLMDRGAYLVDADKSVVNEYDYDTGEVTATYKVPKDCAYAVRAKDRIVCKVDEGDDEYVVVEDLEGNEKHKAKIDNLLTSDNFLGYSPADSDETIFYDLDSDKEIFKADYGDIDWCMQSDDQKYIFISTINKGGYVIDSKTGDAILTLTDVSALYNLTSFENSKYFSLLYIANGGDTRLDIYDKENPQSPIAVIPGGIGINEKDQVVICDGAGKIYSTPILSKEKIYEQGLKYIGDNVLTERQKTEYHCE